MLLWAVTAQREGPAPARLLCPAPHVLPSSPFSLQKCCVSLSLVDLMFCSIFANMIDTANLGCPVPCARKGGWNVLLGSSPSVGVMHAVQGAFSSLLSAACHLKGKCRPTLSVRVTGSESPEVHVPMCLFNQISPESLSGNPRHPAASSGLQEDLTCHSERKRQPAGVCALIPGGMTEGTVCLHRLSPVPVLVPTSPSGFLSSTCAGSCCSNPALSSPGNVPFLLLIFTRGFF